MPIIFPNNPNILDVNWTTGSGGIGMFNQNGSTDENERINATDPFGGTSVIWETRANGSNADDGGWNTNNFNIDKNKLYRFSVWVKRTSSTAGGRFYFGMYDNVIVNKLSDDGTESNPYWNCAFVDSLTQNVWYLYVAHVFPTNTRTNLNHPDTGRYTVAGGISGREELDYCNVSGDLRWNAEATQAVHRVYHYYCPDNTTRLHLWAPRVDAIDGTEPSVEDLLNNRLSRQIASKSNRKTFLNGSTRDKAAPDPSYLHKNGISTNGMYWMNPGGLGPQRFYVDFTYKPGSPMTMVVSNRRGTLGVRGSGSRATYARSTGPWVSVTGTYDANRNYNLWVGLDYWRYFGDTIVQGVKGLQETYVSGTHNVTPGNMDRLAKWKFAGWTSTYTFKYPRDYANLIGSSNSGLFSYHAVNGYNFSTFDNDQSGCSCPSQYYNQPWWYGCCWDGSYFGGGGAGNYEDGPYWVGSTSDYFAYGAIYVCWYDSVFN